MDNMGNSDDSFDIFFTDALNELIEFTNPHNIKQMIKSMKRPIIDRQEENLCTNGSKFVSIGPIRAIPAKACRDGCVFEMENNIEVKTVVVKRLSKMTVTERLSSDEDICYGGNENQKVLYSTKCDALVTAKIKEMDGIYILSVDDVLRKSIKVTENKFLYVKGKKYDIFDILKKNRALGIDRVLDLFSSYMACFTMDKVVLKPFLGGLNNTAEKVFPLIYDLSVDAADSAILCFKKILELMEGMYGDEFVEDSVSSIIVKNIGWKMEMVDEWKKRKIEMESKKRKEKAEKESKNRDIENYLNARMELLDAFKNM